MLLKISRYVRLGTLIKGCATLISILYQMETTYFLATVYEKHHIKSLINFVMHKIKPAILTTGTVKNNFKGTIERFVASDYAFSYMGLVRGTPAYWKQFLYDVRAMVKQLGIFTYFMIFSCANLRWEEPL